MMMMMLNEWMDGWMDGLMDSYSRLCANADHGAKECFVLRAE